MIITPSKLHTRRLFTGFPAFSWLVVPSEEEASFLDGSKEKTITIFAHRKQVAHLSFAAGPFILWWRLRQYVVSGCAAALYTGLSSVQPLIVDFCSIPAPGVLPSSVQSVHRQYIVDFCTWPDLFAGFSTSFAIHGTAYRLNSSMDMGRGGGAVQRAFLFW